MQSMIISEKKYIINRRNGKKLLMLTTNDMRPYAHNENALSKTAKK